MKKVYTSEKIPIKAWLDDIEEGAIKQAKNLANLPFAFHHIALMPDTHRGYGMPIGGVLATNNVVVPNAVGVDIGCGVCAVETDLTEYDTDGIKKVMEIIRKRIPVGFNHHKTIQKNHIFNDVPFIPVVNKNIEAAQYQLGTLGGGNHFMEIQKDVSGHIWLMLHSGSRNFGYKIAQHYHKVAKDFCEMWYSDIPTSDLAFLPLDTPEGMEYIKAMNYALLFAEQSRYQMIDEMINALSEIYKDMKTYREINIYHNYARIENHFGHNVIVHRKGSTSAKHGELGIIPGSQGTASYIIIGLGNKESFMSCSHGAGRQMGRKQAKRELNLKNEIKNLNDAGIIHSIKNESDLDEAPSAYKNIDTVIENQFDLISVVEKLKPLGVIKG